MKQQKTLKIALLLWMILCTSLPYAARAQDSKTDDTTKLVGEYVLVSMAYNFLRSCGAANPQDGAKIEALMVEKREDLFKKHRFSPAQRSEISSALTKLPAKVKKRDINTCYISMDAAKQNLKIWLPTE
ncbi:MAG: hypothetical protein R3E13_04385 [Alphaproteobacteria bacterium]